MFKHPLIHTLKNLRGNARACVYTEPLWGIPFNLYSPYISVYMIALGMTAKSACSPVSALYSRFSGR